MKRNPRRCASPGSRSVAGSPSSWMLPPSGATAPARILMRVLLPAPFSPISASVSPARSSSDASLKATAPPNDLRKWDTERRLMRSPWPQPFVFAWVARPPNSLLHILLRDQRCRHIDHTLLDLFAGQVPFHRVCDGSADALEVLRHRGLEITALGNGLARLRVGVHPHYDDAFVRS